MDPLTQIGLKYSTDKAVDHRFTPFYHSKLKLLREEKLNLLEIGVFHAQSLRTWKEYFFNSTIYGFDIDDRRCYEEDRIVIEQGDQTDIPFIKSVFGDVDFDIIIDDGGHTMFQQQTTLVNIFNRLKPNGVYILEDLHTSLLYHDKASTTLKLVNDIKNGVLEFKNFKVPEEDILRVKSQIEECEIFESNDGHSITSYIRKK